MPGSGDGSDDNGTLRGPFVGLGNRQNPGVNFPVNSVSASAFRRSGPLPTAKDIRDIYMFGIDLTDEEGNELPDKVIEHYRDAALSYLEHNLDIIISQTDFCERYDYKQVDYVDFAFIQLRQRPISKLKAWRAKFPNNRELVEFPEEWFVVEKESGQIQLSPVEGTFSGLIVTQGGSYVPLVFGARSYWPQLFEVEYTAGFCDDQIPAIINEMIGIQTAIRLFEIFGDIVQGQGIANESVSLDGASVTRATTASATFSAFSARVESYKKQMETYMKTVRKYYNAIPMIIA